jgi:nucleoid-associated protein YgaU
MEQEAAGLIRRVLLRAATAVSTGCVVTGLWRATAAALTAVRAGTATFDDVVGLAAATVCWAVLGWVVLALVVTALGSVPGGVGRLATGAALRLTPPTIRRAARFALGLAVVAGPVAVASTASAAPLITQAVATMDPSANVSDVLLLPDVGRPGSSESASASANSHAAGTGSRREEVTAVVVKPGDCLWTISATSLGPGASNADIAAEWPHWYAANRHVIGADPDLLLPGTTLRAPTAR